MPDTDDPVSSSLPELSGRPMPEGAGEDPARLRAELAAAREEAGRLRELLHVAQEFGRLGTWSRDLRTGQATWDQAVLRLWGLDPAGDAHIGLAQMLSHLVESDREVVLRYIADSEHRLGPHAVRFRLRTAQGLVRRLHAQWETKADADGRPARMVGLILDDSDTLTHGHASSELESQLSLAVDAGNVLIWRHDIAAGRVVWSTQGWRALGMVPRPEGLTLEEVRDLIHPDDLARVQASAQEALTTNQPVDLEARYRHSDGSWRTQMLRRVALRNEQGEPVAFLGVALDITERRAEQRRAQAAVSRFETVTRAAGIGYWVNDLTRGRIEWSPECRQIHGLPVTEPVPDTRQWLQTWVHPDDRAAVREAMIERLPSMGAGGLDVSFRIVREQGEVRHLMSHTRVEDDGDSRLVFGVMIDVTERALTETALRNAQERIALALRGAGIGTWEMDLQTRRTLWDEQMWRLRGREPQQESPSEEQLWAWAHPEDGARARPLYVAAEATSEPLDSEFRIITPDGRVRWLASRSTELRHADGRRSRIGVNWDVTAARLEETARRDSELARRESQAKSKFMARMSHELRTPLNAVLGFAQLLLADETGHSPESTTRRRRLDHLQSAGRHLLALIDDVLTLSGVEGGELPVAAQPLALAEVVAEVLPMLSPLQARHEVQLTVDVPATLHALGDATRLRQVLLNLLGNAIKYNRPGGWVHLSAQAEDGHVGLHIADSGRGMDETQLRHLFEPFNRLGAERSEVPGTGIGLAIVKALIERMQGTVAVQSSPGIGTVFKLQLLRAEALPPAPATASEPVIGPRADPGPQARRPLLYIEDNPVNALIIAELVGRRTDLVLHIAATGEAGVAQARSLEPELVLLDMQLPDIDGLEVLRRLQAEPRTAAIPVIALSANAMPDDIERALKAGCADYWTKPLDFGAFMAGLDRLFGQAPR